MSNIPEHILEEWRNYRKPVKGDLINTPLGIEEVCWADDSRFTTYKFGADGKVITSGHYGNVPFFENYNWRIFTVVKK